KPEQTGRTACCQRATRFKECVASQSVRAAHAPPLGEAGRASRVFQLESPVGRVVFEEATERRDRNGSEESPFAGEPRDPSVDWDRSEPACWLFHSHSPKPESTRPAGLDASCTTTVVVPTLELLLHRLVRRVAWAGDGRAGTMRLELGAGELEGTTVLVHADGREISVEVELSPGADQQAWRVRIAERLKASGLLVRELEVR
ncbi:MAG: hypothetical protein JW940_08050, partial [Polyangiaceae bacterium]|nr:hypothetical protein [Polyangiaceae bacterium]